MKRAVCFSLAAMCALACAAPATAEDLPSAQKVIDKYVEATGGVEAKKKIENRIASGSFTIVAMNVAAEFDNYIDPPNVYTDIFLGAFGSVERGLTDGVAWEISPQTGPQILDGEQAADLKRQASLNEMLQWKEHYKSAKTIGEETVDETECYVVEMTPNEGPKSKVYFAKDSGLVVQRVVEPREGVTMVTTLSDYNETDGVTLPHTIATKGGQYDIEIKIAEYTHNTEIPAEKFEMPQMIKELLGQDGEENGEASESEQESADSEDAAE